ncbi:MAG TPA: protein kinase [Polyangiaceae bacterium]|nr:protein kinase [Polyangiaceae bacterium]
MDDHQQLAAGVHEGDVLAGKYRIDKILGIGGMGVVVAAHHIQLDDRVAIKFLLPDALANRETVARFAREAQAAVKIKSEHVARVTDVGTLENGAPFMVMEYLDGGDLSAWLAKRGALPVEQAVEFVLQACEAIAEAHALGIVHRDLKPANLFVIRRPDGGLSVKVLDFGISKRTGFGPSGSSMTRTSAVMGSPLYMSPEQMQSSKDTDPRSDIWALGIILYELVSGDAPFTADTMPELVLKIVSSPAPLLSKLKPDAPVGLERVILRCLERDRSKRFQSVGELAGALVEYGPKRARVSLERITGIMRGAGLSASSLSLPPPSEPASVVPAPAPGTAASWGQTAAGTGRGKGAIFAVAAALVLVGVGIGTFVLRAGSASKPEPSAETSGAQPETAPQHSAPATVNAEPTAAVTAAPAPSAVVVTPAPSEAPAVAQAAAAPAAVTPVPQAAHARPAKGAPLSKPASHSSTTPVVAAPAQAAGHPAATPPPPPAAPKPNVYDDRK